MNDIAQKLRELNQSVPVPLELPDEDDLISVEEALLIPLPADLREYLLTVSDVIYGSFEPVTAVDPNSNTYLPDMAARAWDSGMPREWLPICEDNGEFYCMAPDGIIVCWSEDESDDDKSEWGSIWEWIEDVWLES